MASLFSVLKDRRFWLLAVLAMATLALGRFVLPAEQAVGWVRVSGYWFTLALVLAAGVAVARLLREQGGGLAAWRGGWLWGAIALSLAAWHAHETQGFKILSDEAVLLGTSQNLHLQREVGYALRTTDVRGPFEVLQSTVDKRPVLFPFLVSLVHDWTGYRPTNSFWFNTVLGGVFLVLAAGLARRIAGGEAAPSALLWLAGIPLLAQQVNGGGFELLNLTLLVAWAWLAVHFAERQDRTSQDAFVLVAVLLGATRYESLLYLAPTAALLVWVWARRGAVIFSPLTWLAPVFLLPTFWLNQAFEHNTGFWELKSLGAAKPFGLEFVPDNLGHALAHFLSLDGYQPNSPVFGLLGLLSLPFLLLWAMRKLRAPSALGGEDAGLLTALAGLAAGTAVMMLYFWGQFDHPVIHRLSLPTQLLMWIGLLLVGREAARRAPWFWRGLGAVAVAVLVVWSLPVMARNAYGREYTPAQAYAWREAFLSRLNTRNILVIDRDAIFWTTRKIAVTPIQQARLRADGIAYHLRNRSFEEVYVFQTLNVNLDTGEVKVAPDDELGPEFVLEPVARHRVAIGLLVQMSRLVELKPAAAAAPASDTGASEADAAPWTPPTARPDFLKEWLNNLP